MPRAGRRLYDCLLYTSIEKTTTGYKITFNPAYMDMDGYSREGAVLIDTGEAPLLSLIHI